MEMGKRPTRKAQRNLQEKKVRNIISILYNRKPKQSLNILKPGSLIWSQENLTKSTVRFISQPKNDQKFIKFKIWSN